MRCHDEIVHVGEKLEVGDEVLLVGEVVEMADRFQIVPGVAIWVEFVDVGAPGLLLLLLFVPGAVGPGYEELLVGVVA